MKIITKRLETDDNYASIRYENGHITWFEESRMYHSQHEKTGDGPDIYKVYGEPGWRVEGDHDTKYPTRLIALIAARMG
jgi:hypothetical protein